MILEIDGIRYIPNYSPTFFTGLIVVMEIVHLIGHWLLVTYTGKIKMVPVVKNISFDSLNTLSHKSSKFWIL